MATKHSGRAFISGQGKKTATLRFYADTLTPGLEDFPNKFDHYMKRTFEFMAPRVEAWGRGSAPWRDVTGNARSGLRAIPDFSGVDQYVIWFGHSVPYGIWLEVRNDGKLAVIVPAIKTNGLELMKVIRGLIQRMKSA